MITRRCNRQTQIWDHQAGEQSRIDVKTGQQIACFNMGSTVILLFGPDSITWSDDLQAGTAVQMGQRIGTVLNKL
jgi:phosphatidylserine decarboxylase